ncbi:Uncharacterized protein HZ326_29717 [Fusarium oxysporum f. sp. albedinis]|nr:Uncharacterized protein HZ326_29717 [Fusarium oxysporum f. sp. albedinis]
MLYYINYKQYIYIKVTLAYSTKEIVPSISYIYISFIIISILLASILLYFILILLDIITIFPEVDNVSKLLKSDLYSYYNSNYKYIIKAYNLKVNNFNPIDSAFNIINPNASSKVYIFSKIYKAKASNNCNLIALSQGVLAATIYYINSNIFNYIKIAIKTSLCLLRTCTKIYQDLPAFTKTTTSQATATKSASPLGTKSTATTTSAPQTSTSKKVPSPMQPSIINNYN